MIHVPMTLSEYSPLTRVPFHGDWCTATELVCHSNVRKVPQYNVLYKSVCDYSTVIVHFGSNQGYFFFAIFFPSLFITLKYVYCKKQGLLILI